MGQRCVARITDDNDEGKARPDFFIDPESPYPVIATTSKLMTTEVGAKTCKLVVLYRRIQSMTEFKQIIGRGTRVRTMASSSSRSWTSRRRRSWASWCSTVWGSRDASIAKVLNRPRPRPSHTAGTRRLHSHQGLAGERGCGQLNVQSAH